MSRVLQLSEELDTLLDEGVEGARRRERETFDELAAPHGGTLVLFGAGGLGRRTVAQLRKHGVVPIAVIDHDSSLWGTEIDGVPVRAPADVAREYGMKATFVVTIWGDRRVWTEQDRMSARVNELKALGCERVVTFGPLYWKYPEGSLPFYGADLPHRVHEQEPEVRRAFELWADTASQREYVNQIRWRLQLDFNGLASPVEHPIYFPKDLCALTSGEVFVDCGAYDGDTVELFLAQSGGRYEKIVALEPDPANYARLQATVQRLGGQGHIETYPLATGARKERLYLFADGSAAARIASSSGDGVVEVECVALDDFLGETVPTYLKMDIEGSEIETLKGARRILRDNAPVLAISTYHRQSDLWRIPLLINSVNPDYRFFLRPHKLEMWDLVSYAVPTGRLRKGVAEGR